MLKSVCWESQCQITGSFTFIVIHVYWQVSETLLSINQLPEALSQNTLVYHRPLIYLLFHI